MAPGPLGKAKINRVLEVALEQILTENTVLLGGTEAFQIMGFKYKEVSNISSEDKV